VERDIRNEALGLGTERLVCSFGRNVGLRRFCCRLLRRPCPGFGQGVQLPQRLAPHNAVDPEAVALL
jgi:hypothetical protein